MRISDWSSDVCSSDLCHVRLGRCADELFDGRRLSGHEFRVLPEILACRSPHHRQGHRALPCRLLARLSDVGGATAARQGVRPRLSPQRSEEHTSEIQSLMRISYAVFCFKIKNTTYAKAHRPLTHNDHSI